MYIGVRSLSDLPAILTFVKFLPANCSCTGVQNVKVYERSRFQAIVKV